MGQCHDPEGSCAVQPDPHQVSSQRREPGRTETSEQLVPYDQQHVRGAYFPLLHRCSILAAFLTAHLEKGLHEAFSHWMPAHLSPDTLLGLGEMRGEHCSHEGLNLWALFQKQTVVFSPARQHRSQSSSVLVLLEYRQPCQSITGQTDKKANTDKKQ